MIQTEYLLVPTGATASAPSIALRAVPLPVPLRSTGEEIDYRAAKKAFI